MSARPPAPRARFAVATAADAGEIAALRNAAADHLTAHHGIGWWSGHCTARGVLWSLRQGTVLVVRRRGKILATLTLTPRKPWAIDRRDFTPVQRPLFLINLAVAPAVQGQGLGRACLAAALATARRQSAGSVCLDAYDHPTAGAGPFYERGGFREVGRRLYRAVPLIYYEYLL